MKISFDPVKRDRTLAERGLDFADAAAVFERRVVTLEDERLDYPERRFQTFGLLGGLRGDRLLILVWTPTDDGMRVISMRKCNDRERKKYQAGVG